MSTQPPPLFTKNNNNNFVKDSTDQKFMVDVIEASYSVIVLVDFHAAWCAPCRQMTPLLEKHVNLAQGAIHLVKVDIDRNPAVATQLRISSIPAVYVFHQGKLVDYFIGALSEGQIKEFITRTLRLSGVRPSDTHLTSLLKNAQTTFVQNHFSSAIDLFQKALRIDPEHQEAYIGLIHCYMATNDVKKLRKMLENVPQTLKEKKEFVSIEHTCQTFIEITEEAKKVDSPSVLQQRIQNNPTDYQIHYDLSLAYFLQGNREQAVEVLLDLVKIAPEWQEQKARKHLLQLFDIFGTQHPLTIATRRRLSKILFA